MANLSLHNMYWMGFLWSLSKSGKGWILYVGIKPISTYNTIFYTCCIFMFILNFYLIEILVASTCECINNMNIYNYHVYLCFFILHIWAPLFCIYITWYSFSIAFMMFCYKTFIPFCWRYNLSMKNRQRIMHSSHIHEYFTF